MRRRSLIIGGPNTLKTTSIIKTFPRPIGYISYPGEKGSCVIPTADTEIIAFMWEEEDPAKVNLTKQINELETLTWDLLLGKYGPIKTFAGDGLHKFASLYWNREFNKLLASATPDQKGEVDIEKLQLRAYGNENYGASKEILGYISKVNQSNVDTVVFTCWEGVETEPGQTGYTAQHIFADLPGKLARRIVGEFGVVLYAEVGSPGPDGKITQATWQLRKAGKVWGVGAKTPIEIALTLPPKVPQDWRILYPLLTGEKKWTLPSNSNPPSPKPMPKPSSNMDTTVPTATATSKAITPLVPRK